MSSKVKLLVVALMCVGLSCMIAGSNKTGILKDSTTEEIQISSEELLMEYNVSKVQEMYSNKPINEPHTVEKQIVISKGSPITISRGGLPLEDYKIVSVFNMKATAYGCVEIGGGSWSRTRTETIPEEGRTIAVDPKIIPLGSTVYVECPSYPQINGIRIAEDTGRLIKGHKIDVYFDDVNNDSAVTKKRMNDFGIRQVKIYLLSK